MIKVLGKLKETESNEGNVRLREFLRLQQWKKLWGCRRILKTRKKRETQTGGFEDPRKAVQDFSWYLE